MTRNQGYLIPFPIDPENRRCVQMLIPDSIEHIGIFWGALTELTKQFNWQRTNGTEAMQCALLWREVLQSVQFLDGDCSVVDDIREVNGKLQKKVDGVWVDVQGSNSGNGDCDCPSLVPTVPINPNVADNVARCNAASYFSEWLFEKFNDVLDAIEANTDFIAAIDVILLFVFPPAYVIGDSLTDMWNEIVEAGVNLSRTYDTVENRAMIAELLYCILRQDGELTEAQWDNFENDIPLTGIPSAVFALYVNTITFEGARAEVHKGSYATGNVCIDFDCADWCVTFDMQIDARGFLGRRDLIDVYEDGIGWRIAEGNTSTSAVQIGYAMPELVNIREVTVYLDADNNITNRQFTLVLILEGIEVEVIQYEGNQDEQVHIFEFGQTDVDKIEIYIDDDTPGGEEGQPFNGHIVMVEVCGNGTNPFA